MEQLTEKNKRLVQSLSKKDFFNEYELLLKEVIKENVNNIEFLFRSKGYVSRI